MSEKGLFAPKSFVAIEVVDGAVELIGPGAESEIDGATGVASAFGAGLGLSGELVDGVEGEDDAGDAGDAALVDGGDVVPEIVVVDTVDLPVHLVGAGAVERTVAAAGVACDSRE